MNTTFIYKLSGDFLLGDFKFSWGDQRENIRQMLGNYHSIGDVGIDATRKRDIYENYPNSNDFYFLNYDEANCLREIEIHSGVDIVVENIKLTFDSPFSEVVANLKTISKDYNELAEGEYLFKDLKLTVSDSISMGGEDHSFAYFYCSDNIDHIT